MIFLLFLDNRAKVWYTYNAILSVLTFDTYFFDF